MKGSFIRRTLLTAAAAAMLVPAAFAAAPEEYLTISPEELPTLNYLKSDHWRVAQLSYLVEDGLIEFDRYGLVMPSLATDWTVSDDRRTYTFHIRRGVNWYTHEGKEYAPLTARDFEAGIKWGLNKNNASNNANIIYDNIVGARDYFEGKNTDWNSVGVKVLDDYTIEYTFIRPLPYALKLLAYDPFFTVSQKFLDETGEDFGTSNDTLLYCGAYILSEYEPEYQRILTINPHYWNKDAAHIKRIITKYNKEAGSNGPELFLRGEISEVIVPGTIMDEWWNDPDKKKLIHPDFLRTISQFMGFNFDPHYEEEFAPKDWIEAVNNLNFRKALFHAVDRVAAIMPLAPYDARRRRTGTLTARGLVQYHGVDYTDMSGLDAYSKGDTFDPVLAVQYKKKAMEELKGKVTFPIQVVMPYNTGSVDNVNQAQVLEQQMEKVLGTDFIDIILRATPPTGYNKATRNPGKYSFMRLNWGPDYVDPLSVFDPLMRSAQAERWTRLYMARDYIQPDGRGKFETMVDEANAEVKDLKKRYELFAAAEKFLLDNAFVLPMYRSGGGFTASYVDPFSGYTTQWGDNNLRKLKGARLLEHPMNMEEYAEAEKKYLAERDEARRNAKYE